MTILIVDDHPHNLTLLRAVFEKAGNAVIDAGDGVEALRLLEDTPVDAVVSDVLMPNMDGFRLCIEIRKHARLHGLPFIFLTGTYGSAADRNLAASVGADDYLLKPASATALVEAVDDAVKKKMPHRSVPRQANDEADIIKQYNAALVAKLEERNTELEQTNAQLRASDERFRGTLDRMMEGCQIIGRDWRYLYVNDNAARHAQRTKEQLLGRTVMDCFPGIESSELFHTLRGCMDGRSPARLENEFTFGDGSKAWFELSVQPVSEGIFILSLDVTRRKHLEEMFRQTQKMEAVGTLAGGIAHDFNNALASITGYTELARLECGDNPGIVTHLDAVTKASGRAINLVKQILAFSRQQENVRKPILLSSVVEDGLQFLRATLSSTVEFDISLPRPGPTILADSTQIQQMMMNLGANAAHAMRGRAGRLRVEVQPFSLDALAAKNQPPLRPGHYARLCISDTGHGMDAATLRRIFEPFFTTKGPGEGTGLGLAVVHGIMQNHDGFVTAESEVGKGSRFFLYFPTHGAEEARVGAQANAIPRGGGERILVVDDDPPLAMMGEKLLSFLGYTVEAKTAAVEALEAFVARPHYYDLVITDLTMPAMTGTDLAKQLLQIRPDLPIILVTGYTATLTPERVQSLGIRAMLQKPLTAQALGEVVQRLLPAKKTS